ncbi:MAG TPA: YggS family pyridoxal phosphate-dependent enzyme [Candidatus Alectryocaccomicrobium excrementavium]|uniref:Pyridoxal phosphate homeostasis protein n=1 Tax=Candidatus Alectryocaccomicrobium excrementavium TaxID=2840668 RepID=A0A9D1K755_9FIRM|nr:YggS family pyridoxal phosphate-dependent enzyme [Candidatus Alectryocaccomicrobium excrementavium]
MSELQGLKERFAWYQDRLNDASGRFGGVTICAATKTQPAETVNAAYEAGVRVIGENRVQELLQKFPALNRDFSLHFIGQLQLNKVKYLMDKVSVVQSVDRPELARAINARCLREERRMDVLIEVSVAGEANKGGVALDGLNALLREAYAMEGLRVRGLMAVMPACGDAEEIRGLFRKMRTLFERERDGGHALDCLSMGMTHDCFVAAEEGATMVRLGTALFGARQ